MAYYAENAHVDSDLVELLAECNHSAMGGRRGNGASTVARNANSFSNVTMTNQVSDSNVFYPMEDHDDDDDDDDDCADDEAVSSSDSAMISSHDGDAKDRYDTEKTTGCGAGDGHGGANAGVRLRSPDDDGPDGRTFRMADGPRGAGAAQSAYKQIRYLNSATYICSAQNAFEDDRSSASSEDERVAGAAGAGGDYDRRTYVAHLAGATASTNSVPAEWQMGAGGDDGGVNGGAGDARGAGAPSAAAGKHRSNPIYMPTLDLGQHSWSSNEALTYTNRKVEASNKELIRKTEAYNEWLQAKIESEKYEKRRQWESEQRQLAAERAKEEQRRIERDAKLKDWLTRKQQTEADRLRSQQLADGTEPHARSQCSSTRINSAESLKNYNAWLEKKLRAERRLRERERDAVERKQLAAVERRQKANAVYEQWLETAATKPKPVPLNRGLFTLRGSISNMFVNPVPWDASTDVKLT